MAKRNNLIFYVLFMIAGEFLLLLDAGYMGYIMEHGVGTILDKKMFWIFLFLGIIFRYIAERFKQ